MRFLIRLVAILLALPVSADPMDVPRGDLLRGDLLDELRPLVEYDLGAPVVFVVLDLRRDGDRAFGRVMAQRPGGAEIAIANTPMVQRDHIPLDLIDGPRIEAFFQMMPVGWQVIHFEIGSTDVWYWGYDCDSYGSLLQDSGC